MKFIIHIIVILPSFLLLSQYLSKIIIALDNKSMEAAKK